jgi:serine/threonine protein kinase
MKQHKDRRTLMSEDDALHIIVQIMLGVAYMHSKKMIHRDVTPGTIFLVRGHRGELLVKLGDFGISKVFDSIMFT